MSDVLDWYAILPGWRSRVGGGVLAAGFDWEASIYPLKDSGLFEMQVRVGADSAVMAFDSPESAAGEVINRLRAKRDEHERRMQSLHADTARLMPQRPKRESVDIFTKAEPWPADAAEVES